LYSSLGLGLRADLRVAVDNLLDFQLAEPVFDFQLAFLDVRVLRCGNPGGTSGSLTNGTLGAGVQLVQAAPFVFGRRGGQHTWIAAVDAATRQLEARALKMVTLLVAVALLLTDALLSGTRALAAEHSCCHPLFYGSGRSGSRHLVTEK
jgi:hypothetical protein